MHSGEFQSVHRVFIYLDDILVASNSENDNINDLRFGKTQTLISAHLEKCLFGVKYIDFPGYRICSSGSIPFLSKVEAIKTSKCSYCYNK